MGARHVVLQTSPRVSHPGPLLSRQHLAPHNSFRCNTYESPRKCCKQKTCGKPNSFRCNTYKNRGWVLVDFSPLSDIPTFRNLLSVPDKYVGRPFDLSPSFSCACALFGPTGARQLFWNQFVSHSFHRNGGVYIPPPIQTAMPHPRFFVPLLPCFFSSLHYNRCASVRGKNEL
jgi:hypothetical protein